MSYMITDWRRGIGLVSTKIDEAFGEALSIIPCEAKPNFSPISYDEEAVTLRGEFSYRNKLVFRTSHAATAMSGDSGLIESRVPIVTLTHNSLPWEIHRGDRVRRETDHTLFEVTKVESDGVSRVTLHLTQLGLQEI